MPVFSDRAQQVLVKKMGVYNSISAVAAAGAAGGGTEPKFWTSDSSEILLNRISKPKFTRLNFTVAFQNQQ